MVVEASLVLAVLIPVLLFLSLSYTRHALYEVEAQHMEKVKTAFFQLKSSIERSQLGERAVVTISLGRDPIPNVVPFLPLLVGGTSRGTGTLLFDNSAGGRVVFYSQNSEYADLQLILENGAVILSQEGRETMLFPPAMLAIRKGEKIDVYHQVFELVGENFQLSGGGEISLELLVENICEESENRENLEITFSRGQHENAWWEFLLAENFWLSQRGYEVRLESLEDSFRLNINGPLHYIQRRYVVAVKRVAKA